MNFRDNLQRTTDLETELAWSICTHSTWPQTVQQSTPGGIQTPAVQNVKQHRLRLLNSLIWPLRSHWQLGVGTDIGTARHPHMAARHGPDRRPWNPNNHHSQGPVKTCDYTNSPRTKTSPCKHCPIEIYSRADSRFTPSQWEITLLCNDLSHWLGASLESTLYSLFACHGSITSQIWRFPNPEWLAVHLRQTALTSRLWQESWQPWGQTNSQHCRHWRSTD